MLLTLQGDDFLSRAYLHCLDRPADEAGMRVYRKLLAAGVSQEAIIAELEASPEGQRVLRRRGGRARLAVVAKASVTAVEPAPDSAQTLLALIDDSAFLGAAYLALFGREVDPSGLDNYLSQLCSGVSREQVLCELAASPEAVAFGRALPGMDDLFARQSALEAENAAAAQPVSHVNELMGLPVDQFLKAAYVAVLGREVDPEGFALYSDLLRQGWSRSYVLCELLASDEGRQLSVALPGLKGLARRYRKAQARSLRGWYHRSVKGAESDLPSDRLLRAALSAALR